MSTSDTKVIKELLEAGVHFGHQTNRWNPKMKKYIFGAKSGIYIIDLQKTKELLDEASKFLREVARAGSYILFVGTKKQAALSVQQAAEQTNMFYVNNRWLGGTLTNFETVSKSITKLDKLEAKKTDGTYDLIAKKEKSDIEKQISKLLKNLAGIRKMDRLPGALVVIDSKEEDIAIKEAKKLNIPIVGLVDTNSDPDDVNYVIPGNDDALKSIKYITETLIKSVEDGRKQFLAAKPVDKTEETAEEAKIQVKKIAPKKVEEVKPKIVAEAEEKFEEKDGE
ncbi:MAG: 30S ribosomal protein S2 [Candidatus Omnitrophica bacterium]|nr:30S ribosomal protein S2 [Candidatus Omnitrophota bacterium]